jgi:hypothetical protein
MAAVAIGIGRYTREGKIAGCRTTTSAPFDSSAPRTPRKPTMTLEPPIVARRAEPGATEAIVPTAAPIRASG